MDLSFPFLEGALEFDCTFQSSRVQVDSNLPTSESQGSTALEARTWRLELGTTLSLICSDHISPYFSPALKVYGFTSSQVHVVKTPSHIPPAALKTSNMGCKSSVPVRPQGKLSSH